MKTGSWEFNSVSWMGFAAIGVGDETDVGSVGDAAEASVSTGVSIGFDLGIVQTQAMFEIINSKIVRRIQAAFFIILISILYHLFRWKGFLISHKAQPIDC